MDEKGIDENAGTDQNQPTTSSSGPQGEDAAAGGAGKRGPISTSPTIGHTIAGRSLGGEGATEPGIEPGEEEAGGGIDMSQHPHLDHE